CPAPRAASRAAPRERPPSPTSRLPSPSTSGTSAGCQSDRLCGPAAGVFVRPDASTSEGALVLAPLASRFAAAASSGANTSEPEHARDQQRRQVVAVGDRATGERQPGDRTGQLSELERGAQRARLAQ